MAVEETAVAVTVAEARRAVRARSCETPPPRAVPMRTRRHRHRSGRARSTLLSHAHDDPPSARVRSHRSLYTSSACMHMAMPKVIHCTSRWLTDLSTTVSCQGAWQWNEPCAWSARVPAVTPDSSRVTMKTLTLLRNSKHALWRARALALH